MENSKNYADKIRQNARDAYFESQRLDSIANKVDSYTKKFDALMSLSDTQVKAMNYTDEVMAKDPVYNSPLADDRLKKSIETRKLNGMSKEEFLDSYKAVLNGINLNERQETKQETGLVKITNENLDIVPVSIDLLTAANLGYSPDNLLAKCQQYDITNRQIADLAHMQEAYETKAANIFKWMKEGYSLNDIREFLNTRETVSQEIAANSKLSVTKIMEFAERFGLPIDSEVLSETMSKVYYAYHTVGSSGNFIDSPIGFAMSLADNLDCDDIDYVLERINFTPALRDNEAVLKWDLRRD